MQPPNCMKTLAFFALLFLAGAAAGSDGTGFERLVPADVNSFVVLRDFQELNRRIGHSPYASLAGEPFLQVLADNLYARMAEPVREIHVALGTGIQDISDLLHGQATVAVRKTGPGDAGAALYLVEIAPTGSEAVEALIARMIAFVGETGQSTVSREDIGGRRVVTFDFQNGQTDRADENARLFVSLNDGILAVLHACDRELLDQHFALRDGEMPAPGSLAELPLYAGLKRSVSARADYLSFKNFGVIWSNVRGAADTDVSKESGSGGDVFFERIGLFSLLGTMSALRFGADGITWEGASHIAEPAKGIWKSLRPISPPDLRPPPFVDANAAFFAAFYLDLPQLWTEIADAMWLRDNILHESFFPASAPPDDLLLKDLDIVSLIGNRFYLYMPEQMLNEAGGKTRRLNAAAGIEVREPEKLEAALRHFLSSNGIPYAGSVVLGHTVLTIGAAEGTIPFGHHAAGILSAPSFAFVDDLLLVTADPGLMPELIRKGRRRRSPLMMLTDFQSDLQRLTPSPFSFLYADAGTVAGAFGHAIAPALENLGLPARQYEVLTDYLPRIAAAAKWRDDGLYCRVWLPHPAEE